MTEKMGTAQQVNESLKHTIREGRELLSDFKRAIKDLKEASRSIDHNYQKEVRQRLEATVCRELAIMQEKTEKAMRDSVDKVGKEFDKLERIFLGKENGDVTLEELIKVKASLLAGKSLPNLPKEF